MLAILLGLFRLIWLLGRGHHAVALENLALRQQLAIYKRREERPRLVGRDRWFWIALSVVWKDWRKSLLVVHLLDEDLLAPFVQYVRDFLRCVAFGD